MSLWGDIDISANKTGTVTTTTSSTTVNGSGTAFTTELEVGQYITITDDSTGTEHQIKSITSNTVLDLYANPTEAESGKAFQVTTKPKYDNENVFGITSAEAPGGVTPGWVKVTNGTGNRAGRTQYETLVAFGDHTKPSESADLDTGLFGVITLSTVADQSAATGQAEAFSVTATTTNSVTATFQWQVQTGGTGAFADIAGATTGTLTIADNTGLGGNRYRCVVSGTGATTVTSNSALLTET
jgi:hypothetical protein